MSNSQLLQELIKEAKRSKAFTDVCLVLATRERSRSTLTIDGLRQRMVSEGFDHPLEVYREIILFLGKLGLGEVLNSKRGKVIGLTGLKMTLQSIGIAACGEGDALNAYKQKLSQRQGILKPETTIKRHNVSELVNTKVPLPPVSLTMYIQGVPIDIKIPGERSDVLADIVNRLKIS